MQKFSFQCSSTADAPGQQKSAVGKFCIIFVSFTLFLTDKTCLKRLSISLLPKKSKNETTSDYTTTSLFALTN